MPLDFRCSGCGGSMKYSASKCPHCMRVVTADDINARRQTSERGARTGVMVLGGAIVAGFLLFVLARQPQPIGAAQVVDRVAPARPSEPSEISMITAAQIAVKSRLRDPSSASFRNETIGRLAGKPVVVCGEVNAKNGFGGMTGFERDISNGASETVLEAEMQGRDFSPVWNKMGCRG